MRKIDIPYVRRDVGALRHVTHVTQITLVDDVPIDFFGYAVEFHCLRLINRVEQRRKCVAKIETAPTAVANIEDAFELIEQRFFAVEFVGLPVEGVPGWRLEATLASWNRLTCERSALASVSNQSAISSNFSSRAVLAIPGYMSVYSCVSPAIAAARLAEVERNMAETSL